MISCRSFGITSISLILNFDVLQATKRKVVQINKNKVFLNEYSPSILTKASFNVGSENHCSSTLTPNDLYAIIWILRCEFSLTSE